jgi:hypothetical protein
VLAAYIASAAVTLGHLAAAVDVRSHNLLHADDYGGFALGLFAALNSAHCWVRFHAGGCCPSTRRGAEHSLVWLPVIDRIMTQPVSLFTGFDCTRRYHAVHGSHRELVGKRFRTPTGQDWSGRDVVAAAAGRIQVRAAAAKSGALIGAGKAARCGVTVCYRRHDDGSFGLHVACGPANGPASRGTALQCCSSHWSRDRQRGLCGA